VRTEFQTWQSARSSIAFAAPRLETLSSDFITPSTEISRKPKKKFNPTSIALLTENSAR
jgi:hypothetical protein